MFESVSCFSPFFARSQPTKLVKPFWFQQCAPVTAERCADCNMHICIAVIINFELPRLLCKQRYVPILVCYQKPHLLYMNHDRPILCYQFFVALVVQYFHGCIMHWLPARPPARFSKSKFNSLLLLLLFYKLFLLHKHCDQFSHRTKPSCFDCKPHFNLLLRTLCYIIRPNLYF